MIKDTLIDREQQITMQNMQMDSLNEKKEELKNNVGSVKYMIESLLMKTKSMNECFQNIWKERNQLINENEKISE